MTEGIAATCRSSRCFLAATQNGLGGIPSIVPKWPPASVCSRSLTRGLRARSNQYSALETTVVGCLFHLRQAVHRRMQRIYMSSEELLIVMARGVMYVLTILPIIRSTPRHRLCDRSNQSATCRENLGTVRRSGQYYGSMFAACGLR